ncbi:MAG: hypothetical protein P1U53_04605 [Sulfitobacter sp.]|nr:hypothetical protein [Sulfitobacter sp.]
MMTEHDKISDAELELLFEEARAEPPRMPPGLMARVLAEAEIEQPALRGSGWRDWLSILGGAPGLGGLVTASAFGLWLGMAPPDALPDVAGLFLDATGTETLEGTELWNDGGWIAEES